MSPAPSPLPLPIPPIYLPTKHKQKPLAVGIAAGAEDAKYQAKYKELKRKVKDIESDNDKLHFKVLQAKLSIRRMKMERAVLYERLSVAPPSPTMQDRLPQPPMHPLSVGPGHQPPSRIAPGSHQHLHPSSMDSDQVHVSPEHIRPQGNPRLAPGSDGRSASIMDNSNVALSPHMPVHSPRRISGSHESSRHHLPPMPPQISASHTHPYDPSRAHSIANAHASPPLHHTHASSSHSRNRSHSSPRSRSQHIPPPPYRGGPGQHHHYSESLPPVHQPMHSPPPERERSRRGEPHEYVGSHADPHPYDRHQTHLLSPRMPHSDARSTGRIHSHQRLGPGTYITREEFQDKSRDLEREREWEREREHEREQRERNRDYSSNNNNSRSREIEPSYLMHSPPPPPHVPLRSRSQMDRGDYDPPHVPPSSRSRGGEEGGYYHDSHPPSSYPRLTRSDTPGSGSASGSGAGVADVPSRPDSRSQYYERDRGDHSRFRLRPVTQPSEEVDFGHDEGGRSQTRADRAGAGAGGGPVGMGGSNSGGGGGSFSISDPSRPSMDSRKRSRNDMDVDSDNDVGDGPSGASGSHYSSARLHDDRGSKRYHREHTRRSVDAHEDSRMGPS